jgi:alginate O-acetyltransferase complex protein AlgI
MVFSSFLFIFFFLPIALAVYYLLPRAGRHLGLVVLSYVFYGWANPVFIFLLLFSTLVDYFVGLALTETRPWGKGTPAELSPGGPRTRRQKALVTLSVVTNLGLLGFFKYFYFVTDSFAAAAEALGLPAWELDLAVRVILPLGISFYTFQSMSYTIDIYRGQGRPLRNFIDFATYVSLFPQLVAGPIIRYREVARQILDRTHTPEKFARGVCLFGLGVAKKVIIANPCGKVADLAFMTENPDVFTAWMGALGYALQIYFDFSAYSDMAIGLGLMLGFVFPKNFDSPYKARSITDFWRRWHISLSSWLRDYLYIPLGGNKKGPSRTYINLLLVMVLGGLWHGASWTFVIWGGIHGLWLAFDRATGGGYGRWLPPLLSVPLTFILLLPTWVFFRADSLEHALGYIGSMLGLVTTAPGAPILQGVLWQPYHFGILLLGLILAWFFPQSWQLTRKLTPLKAIYIFAVFFIACLLLLTQTYNPFIYFIF